MPETLASQKCHWHGQLVPAFLELYRKGERFFVLILLSCSQRLGRPTVVTARCRSPVSYYQGGERWAREVQNLPGGQKEGRKNGLWGM